ncbi:hypothetical protein ACFYZN_26105 [Streptomyces sp. NPDC001777]|uniref:hypothetical protein n=1 Tax=Streptomyces sp. NPDC001777 TaxID=3364608 RepID=UPI0036B70D23
MVRAAAPRLDIGQARPLGPDPLLAAALGDRLVEAGLRRRLGRPVVPARLCASSPTPAEAVRALRATGHRRVRWPGT